jgi:hypothetical protein
MDSTQAELTAVQRRFLARTAVVTEQLHGDPAPAAIFEYFDLLDEAAMQELRMRAGEELQRRRSRQQAR